MVFSLQQEPGSSETWCTDFTDEQGVGGSSIFPATKQGDIKKLQAALATQSSLAQWVENALQMQQPCWKSSREEVVRTCAGNKKYPVVMEGSHDGQSCFSWMSWQTVGRNWSFSQVLLSPLPKMLVWAPSCQEGEGGQDKLFRTWWKMSKNTEIWAPRTGGILVVCSSHWAEVRFWNLSRFLGLLKSLHAKLKEFWKMGSGTQVLASYFTISFHPFPWGCLLVC